MTAQYIATQAGNHGIDYVTDSGKKGFVIGILDERSARTLAAGAELLNACQSVLSTIEGMNVNDASFEEDLQTLRAAIQKATQP
jgi:hypothetical protein